MKVSLYNNGLYDFNVIIFDESLEEFASKRFSEYPNLYEDLFVGDVNYNSGKFECPTNLSITKFLNKRLKYISYSEPRKFILFNIWQSHDLMATIFELKDIKSAGDFDIQHFVCGGHSIGLSISSLPEDTELLRNNFMSVG